MRRLQKRRSEFSVNQWPVIQFKLSTGFETGKRKTEKPETHGNAIKHTGSEEPLIQVAWRDREAFVEFSVCDNGQGIAPQYHERIFGIFQTLEARDKVEGTGIGLSVVKKIVETKGGRVWVESDIGQGAAFRFLWPRNEISGE
ncbi:MAG: hypothetical protein H0U59_05595 [Gemmatimonadaceae bacterium]|nr:hypothetical protein [Gemmatimonadaceae bacterium]